MKEICTIGSQIWSYNVPNLTHCSPGFAYSYAFYDVKTGEVWGKRTVVEGRTCWIYTARQPETMDMTIPVEWVEESIPAGLMCALIVAAGEKLTSTNVG